MWWGGFVGAVVEVTEGATVSLNSQKSGIEWALLTSDGGTM